MVTDTDGTWSSTSTGTPAGPGTQFRDCNRTRTHNVGVVGYLSSSTDSDYFKFELNSTSEVFLFTAGPYDTDDTLTSGSIDSAGTLYDSSQTLIQYSDESSSLSPRYRDNYVTTEQH